MLEWFKSTSFIVRQTINFESSLLLNYLGIKALHLLYDDNSNNLPFRAAAKIKGDEEGKAISRAPDSYNVFSKW